MSEFKRENRYMVFKISDIENYLNEGEYADLHIINDIINEARQKENKPFFECVVIESGWSIYNQAWDMVQRLAEDRPQEVEQLKARIARLEEAASKAREYADSIAYHTEDEFTQMCVMDIKEFYTDALNESPQQSLVEIQADAVMQYDFARRMRKHDEPVLTPAEYADQLINSVKDGE